MEKKHPPGKPHKKCHAQYDDLSAQYSSLASSDPVKKYVQYPGALELLGQVSGEKILDIGCGSGTFSRMLARQGARVTGYDPSAKQIAAAKKSEEKKRLGIKYYTSERLPAGQEHLFNQAVSIMVLLYAADKEDLKAIFSDAARALKNKGAFSSVTFNPCYKRLGKAIYRRRFSKTRAGKMQVDFLDQFNRVDISAQFSYFSVADFENAASKAGFTKIRWVRLAVAAAGKLELESAFWDEFENDPPYIGLRVE